MGKVKGNGGRYGKGGEVREEEISTTDFKEKEDGGQGHPTNQIRPLKETQASHPNLTNPTKNPKSKKSREKENSTSKSNTGKKSRNSKKQRSGKKKIPNSKGFKTGHQKYGSDMARKKELTHL